MPRPAARQAINCFQFANILWLSSYAIVTLPLESQRFFPKKHDVALGAFLAIAGISQLSGPVAGYASDRYASKYGRRRPMMVRAGAPVGRWSHLPALLRRCGLNSRLGTSATPRRR